MAPAVVPETGLDKACALSKIKVIDPDPPKGPRMEAVATTGEQTWGTFASQCYRESVLKGFRSRNIERDSTAASFKFNNSVRELRAKLDSGEIAAAGRRRKGRNDREGVLVRNQNAGTADYRQPDWESPPVKK